MNIICWNCRGAGKAATVRELRDLAKQFAPTVLCVVETQISATRVEGLASTLGFDNGYAVSSNGRSGGIGMFWNNEINLEILGYSEYHLDAKVSMANIPYWRLTCVYGEAQTGERYKTWNTMKSLASTSTLPWTCMGDFNEVLRAEEHVGTGTRRPAQIGGFWDAVDVCGLVDLWYTGRSWTFEKKISGGAFSTMGRFY